MELKTEIVDLIAAINRLASALERNATPTPIIPTNEHLDLLSEARAEQTYKEVLAHSDEVERHTALINEATAISEAARTVSAEDCRQLCLTIVRKNRDKKPEVVGVINSFNDAKKVEDLPESDLPALHDKLTAILEGML